MRQRLIEYTAEERALIFVDRSLSSGWLVETSPLTPEERASLLSVGAGPEENFDKLLPEEDQLPPHTLWFRPEEVDWSSPLIQAVLDAMPEGTHLLEATGFLLTPQSDLEIDDGVACRPVDWLAQGHDLEPVLTLASGIGAQ